MHLELPDILTKATAADLCRALNELPDAAWDDGRDTAGPQARSVKSNLQLPLDHPVSVQVRQAVLHSLDRSAGFLSAALPLKVFTPRVNRYDPAHPAFGWHVDNAIRLRGDGLRVRTDLSCTVFLNEPQDYDGGELEFRQGDALHRLKLPAGQAVLYPSGTVHRVLPVTRGARLACFFWVQSLVADDAERHILHQLDQHLTALRSRLGESEETVGLMATYHNLLRRWSQTG